MSTPDDLKNLIADAYGLMVGTWVNEGSFDAANQKEISEDGTEKIFDNGTFTTKTFDDPQGSRYTLVQCDGNFPENEKLVQWMKDADLFAVKEYRLVPATNPQSGYFLYELIPHTVNGVRDWNA